MNLHTPLAEQLRPKSLDDVIGQLALTGEGKLLRRIVETKQPQSLIFWGPPGSGKTTLARILADATADHYYELSAVVTGKKEVMQLIAQAESNRRLGESTILFVDEIHRFNKAQQDAFLPYIENGTIILFGATTENPSFEVIAALLSRCRVVVLAPIKLQDVVTSLSRARKALKLTKKIMPDKLLTTISDIADGDARSALNILEAAANLAAGQPITKELVLTAAQTKVPSHDKNGESHFNLVSALIKSLRGSNATAALYYLARLLQAGEDPKFIARRMVVFASEDIGLAAPAALNLAVSMFLAVERIGLPECRYVMYHCATVLAKAPKSRETTEAMTKAEALASEYHTLSVPLHLRNAPTSLMKDLGYNQGYKWQAGFKDQRGFLPPEISDVDFFA